MTNRTIEAHEHPDYCWIHHVVEKPGYFRCGECFHWFPDEGTLLDDYNAGSPSEEGKKTDPNEVFFCPHCAHDF